VNRQPERDAVDRVLRQSLREQEAGEPADACLESDMLAAWIDGTLTRDELLRAEAHTATCARCQSILASVVRITPPPAARQRWWSQMATVRWLVPIAAIATLALWIALPLRQSGRSLPEVARTERAPAVTEPSSAMASASPQPADERTAAAVIPPGPRLRAEAADAYAAGSRARGTAASKMPQNEARRDEAKDAQVADARRAQAGPPTASVVARQPSSASEAAPPPPASPAPPPAPPVGQSADAKNAARTVEADAAAKALPPAGFASSGGLAGRVDVLSGDAVRWRPGGPGTVQRSIDGGVTWTTQQTGTTVAISAGSCPTPLVCWLVGQRGTVLLSTDGATWRLVSLPQRVDLIAIRAIDAKTAIVTASDGRRFSTADGGATWGPPQEFPPAPFSE
jgi:hypothetical protein